MSAILDTSILINGWRPPAALESAISVVSLAELHYGALATADPVERARRLGRLAIIEHEFEPVPVTGEVARAYGLCASVVANSGRNPRSRAFDLLIAATALVMDAQLYTHNVVDFRGLEQLVEIVVPELPELPELPAPA